MNGRSVTRIVAAAAFAAALGVAVTLPATASSPSQDAELPAAHLAALQEHLGMTVEDVTDLLAAQQDAADLESQLQQTLNAEFAGAWLRPATGQLIVATTDPATVDDIRAAGAEARVVQTPLSTLQSIMAGLDARGAAAPDSVTSWHVDPQSNTVVVSATDPAAAEAFVGDQESVTIEQVSAQPRPLVDLVGGEAITTSVGGRCSLGFNASSGGTDYVITAGHCTDIGGTWSAVDGSSIGPVATSSFPGDDYGTIEVTGSSAVPTGQVSDHSGGTITITGSTEASIGAETCRSGSTTGYQCGTVETLNQTVNYGGGDVVDGLTQTDACAEPGDSGGSFVSGSQAQGMTSGGSGDCSSGGTTFFQPVNEALSDLGLTLTTG